MAQAGTPSSKPEAANRTIAPEVSLEPTGTPTSNTAEAKTRFNAALDEAKAGAAALKAEATTRATAYKAQAKGKSHDLMGDAKAYGADAKIKAADLAGEAKVKAGDLAVEGKAKASDAISGLGKMVADNAGLIDDKLGAKYGDYARSASRSLQDTAAKLDAKTVDELSEDARAMVRKSPAAAVGIAAVIGFMFARLFSGSKD
ncbi:hypothetical protein [Allopontixanthobacter confluentis]|uniref:hypothetical protein n=1 Tax=Allopontixanthobacter confluentis TaxID=1849021 RepID=UPI00192781DB|nr:hypothetical protein [Allopontixanthobacter confluentis]